MREPRKNPTLARWARSLRGAVASAFAREGGAPEAPRREESLLDWGRRFLPRHFAKPPSAMHRWLAERLDAMADRRGARVNLIGPRGSAKSTIATLAYVLRAAVERREPYLWIVSDTKHQAQAHLDNLKTELLENELLAEAYPRTTGKGPRWRAGSVELRGGVVVEAYGTGQRIRGRRRHAHRPTLIVCDDLENDSHMASSRQREASRDWFHGTLMKAGTRRTNVVNLATALHRDALAMRLAQTGGWDSETFRSILRWPEATELWEEWERLYCDRESADAKETARAFFATRRGEMERGAELLWPEEEDLYSLMQMRVESGIAAFEREKQSSPVDPERCEWPESYFDDCWFDAWPERLTLRTIALDPSKGNDARQGDYSAIVMLGVDASGALFVEADMARRPTPRMVADAVAWHERFRPDAFGVEANQYQHLLAGEFVSEFHRRGLLGISPCEVYNQASKTMRIRRLGPYLSQRRFRFKRGSPSTELLVDQLRDFPLGSHDDGPDALEMALRLAEEVWRSRNPRDATI